MKSKRDGELTVEDFRDFAVWISDDQTAAIYVPREKRGAAPLLSLVGARFTAADGTQFIGFGTVTKLAFVAPVLFIDGTQLSLHFGEMIPTREDLDQIYARLQCSAAHLFPLTFEIVVPVKYKPVWNRITAFTYKEPYGPLLRLCERPNHAIPSDGISAVDHSHR